MFIAIIASISALVYSYYLIRWILTQPTGSPKMNQIADAIKQGSDAYLKRQTINISYIAIPLAIVLGLFLGLNTAIGFILFQKARGVYGKSQNS